MTQIQIQKLDIEEECALEQLKYSPLEIERLVNDMAELKETFQIVNTMVYEQGSGIEAVENYVENVSGQVQNASAELEKAATFQKKAMKKKGILYGLGLLAINVPHLLMSGFRSGVAKCGKRLPLEVGRGQILPPPRFVLASLQL